MMTELLNDLHPFIIGGASAGVVIYLISNAVQIAGVLRLCDKMGFSRTKKWLLAALVIIPFGMTIALAVIAFDKEHARRAAR
ncbi:MAG: hypothetical protein FWE46_01990 [Coriobacteriia bacterium]|nr:hypothetical protein [Coriobacteriia bacterium]MCL2536965.1 hypothetical protein [Coriobacteriia bacterium]